MQLPGTHLKCRCPRSPHAPSGHPESTKTAAPARGQTALARLLTPFAHSAYLAQLQPLNPSTAPHRAGRQERPNVPEVPHTTKAGCRDARPGRACPHVAWQAPELSIAPRKLPTTGKEKGRIYRTVFPSAQQANDGALGTLLEHGTWKHDPRT